VCVCIQKQTMLISNQLTKPRSDLVSVVRLARFGGMTGAGGGAWGLGLGVTPAGAAAAAESARAVEAALAAAAATAAASAAGAYTRSLFSST
jgi:hypothetical protein